MIRPVQVAINPELPDDIEIGYSSWRFLPPIGFALAMMFLSAGRALDWGVGGHDFVGRMAGYAGVACFGLVTAKLVWALLKVRAPVQSVGRYGIRDLRIANEFILWASVTDVSACRLGRQNFVVLKLTPALERRLFCVDTAKALLAANRALGIDGRRQPGRRCHGFRQFAENLLRLFCRGKPFGKPGAKRLSRVLAMEAALRPSRF
jgi:hypothetical protein